MIPALAVIFLSFLSYLIIYFKYKVQVLTVNAIPRADTILILGAGLDKNGQPSDILIDRLITTYTYFSINNPKIIIASGTKKENAYNEPLKMKEYLLLKDVPRDIINLDESGFSTLDSLINLRHFEITEPVLIISQKFHLYRALLLGDLLSIKALGLAANNLNFSIQKRLFWTAREMLAIPYNLLKLIIYKLK